jgi:predicted dehydrogenase
VADLRIGVIGAGTRSHIAGHAHWPGHGSRVVGVYDVDHGRAVQVACRYGPDVRAVTDLAGLLALGLDAVLLLSPDDTHEALAVTTLEAGVATFVEKPVAITVDGADRVLAAAARTGTPLYVGHNMRHMPVVAAMRDLVLRGVIGEVKAIWCRHFVGHGGDYYFRDWHADRRRTTGLLLQKGAHDLDVIHWLAGAFTARVNAIGDLLVYGSIVERQDRSGHLLVDWYDPEKNWPPTELTQLAPVIDVEDISMVNLVLANGVLASYQQCHFTPDYWRNYTVLGTAGRLENFGDVDEGAVVKVWQHRSGYRDQPDLLVEVPQGEGLHGGADALVVGEFLRLVRGGGSTLTSPVAARQAVAAACAATESLRNGGRPVDVPHLANDIETYFNTPRPGAARPAPHAQRRSDRP